MALLLGVRPSAAQPTLGIAGAGHQATLFWPATTSGTNGVLESAASLASPSWVTATDAVPVNYGPYTAVSVTNSLSPRFFRLSLVPPSADGMALIPAGSFTMGDTLDPYGYPVPTSIYVAAFYMDTNLVSYSQWQAVYAYATSQHYAFDNAGAGKAENHPVQTVDWYDAVKWCNARSEQAGLPPCYYTDSGLTAVYRNGKVDPYVNWSANGYRLPTEAEWEKAARGGLRGQRFPWGLTISESQANYNGCTNCYIYDLGPSGYNATFNDGVMPYTSPVGYFAANGYGLYDMAGNVWEWCWDWYGSYRELRGGSWLSVASFTRCAHRNDLLPSDAGYDIGLRCVRADHDTRQGPVVTISAPKPTVPEARNPDGTTNAGAFRIERTGSTSRSLHVQVALGGTAFYYADYLTVPPLFIPGAAFTYYVTVPAGTNAVTVLVYPIDDERAEPDQTVVLTVIIDRSAPNSYLIGQSNSATVTIIEDNDPNRPPTISLITPPNGTSFPSSRNIPLGARLSDPDANFQSVEFFLDGLSLGIISISNNVSGWPSTNQFASLVLPDVPPGPHLVSAQVTDIFGASATNGPVLFTVLNRGANPPLSAALPVGPYSLSSHFLDGNGALYAWGDGEFGQLADGTGAAQNIPMQVAPPQGATGWTQASGGDHALAIANNGRLYAWGNNCCGQLGIGRGTNTTSRFVPVPVLTPDAVTGWKKASAGGAFSVAVDDRGRLYAWGENYYGELGIGSTVYQYTPVLVPFPDGVTNWLDVSAGGEHTLALADSGAIYAWGDNEQGQLGNNLVSSGVSHPVPVLLPSGVHCWRKIAAGAYNSFAFGDDGNLYGWGYHQPVAALIPPIGAPWAAVAPGLSQVLALAEDGKLYALGYNHDSRLGTLSGGLVPFPESVTRWKVIAAGYWHSLALGDNCQLYAWGLNYLGAIGDGTFINRTNPTAVKLQGDLCSAPTVFITSPTNGSIFVSPVDLTITATATSRDAEIVGVDFLAGTNFLGHSATPPYSISWPDVPLGSYALVAIATDNLGASTISEPLNITVISPSRAVAELIEIVERMGIASKTVKRLIQPLESAERALDKGHTRQAVAHLVDFEDRVRERLADPEPVLAAQLLEAAQQIIQAVQP